jgi:hypothetical protein
MLFFRVYQHLLPRAVAWSTTKTTKTLRKLFEGLSGAPTDARAYIDDVHADLFPATTRALAAWEQQWGLSSDGTEAARRLQLAAAWRAQGGQSPRYLQDVVQAAGFPLFIHEWWWPPNEAPRTPRNPLDYTNQPLIGSIQCGEPMALCGEPEAQANRWLVNEIYYLVNSNLTPEAPPPVPDDPSLWPYFIYWAGETFADHVAIPATRRAELERLILKLTPAHCWNVLLVDWTSTDESVFVIDGSNNQVIDESGNQVIA